MLRKIYLLALPFILASCEAFDIHPYAGNVSGKKNINEINIQKIEERYAHKDSIKYVFISDSQRWHDELEDFVKEINKRDDIDFIVHGGDIADFGLTKEFLIQRDILEKLNKPYVVIIGNHDCLANGEEVFEVVFGKQNFSFTAAKTKFVGLNTNALESNYANPIPNFSFIKQELEKSRGNYNQTVVIMHAKPTTEQFDNNVAELFQYSIKQFPNLLYCMNGHGHRYDIHDIFGDKINYYEVPNIGKRQFIIFSVTPGQHTHELHSY